MSMTFCKFFLVLIGLTSFAVIDSVSAQDEPHAPPPVVGDVLETIDLQDLDGALQSIPTRAKGRKLTAVCFFGVGCPISKLYAPKLEALAKEFAPRGVQFLGVDSNRQDDIEDIREFARRGGLGFPLIRDEGNRLADRLGAIRCTEVFVVDVAGRLRFHGAVDDQYTLESGMAAGKGKAHPEKLYLRDALSALLDGRKPPVATTEAPGCHIGRFERTDPHAKVTYYRDVEPILQRRCQECHRPGEIGPFPLLTWEDAAGWGKMMAEVVAERRMPPWQADPKFGHWANDRSLRPREKRTLLDWVAAGMPAGKVAERPRPRSFAKGWRMGKPDVVLEMPEPFTVPADGQIPYHHVLIDPGFKEDRWVSGIEIRPGAREVVHHIMLFLIDLEHLDPQRWYEEFDGGKNGYFALMVPGEAPTIFPEGMAKRIPAGHQIIMTIHYQPVGRVTTDRSRIGLRFAKSSPRYQVFTEAACQDDLLIVPPHAKRRIFSSFRFERDTMILSFTPHMHYRGRAFEYEAHYPSEVHLEGAIRLEGLRADVRPRFSFDEKTGTLRGMGHISRSVLEMLLERVDSEADKEALHRLQAASRSEVLLKVSNYDFGWQNTYILAEPKLMPKGTLLVCFGDFDNTTANPWLTKEMAAHGVRWGLQSTDEMMIGYFDEYFPDGTRTPQRARKR